MTGRCRWATVGDGSQRGSAYLVVLMALLLLSSVGLSLSLVTQTGVLAGSQERAGERTFYAAESGLELAVARALAMGDFTSAVYVRGRASVEQGRILRVDEVVVTSPLVCTGEGPCNFCAINQGATWVRRSHVLSSQATRGAVVDAEHRIELGRRRVAEMIDVEPTRSTLACAGGPSADTDPRGFDAY